MREIKTPIIDGLEEYINAGHKPWHMPGHKRKITGEKIGGIRGILTTAQAMDVTEVPGTDDLHMPTGMIAESQEMLADIYGTYAGYYLINGSTCGIFTAIAACAKGGLIAADNCHKSVHNAAQLLNIPVTYVPTLNKDRYDKVMQDEGFVPASVCCAISPEAIEKACKENPEATAIIITSPTYEGVISDINAISVIAKSYGMWLIVDEAHGAHLPYMNPELSAIYAGADIVVQSLHKTLEAYTQTAVLHLARTEKVIDNQGSITCDIKKYLSVFMSSSPSYILLSSMEYAVSRAAGTDYGEYKAHLADFRQKCEALESLSILSAKTAHNIGAYGYDETRIVIYDKSGKTNGIELENLLAEAGDIICEMSGADYVVLISTYVDTKQDFEDLYETLVRVDRIIQDETYGKKAMPDYTKDISHIPKVGDVIEEDMYVYPPGIPIARCGEMMTEATYDELVRLIVSGKKLHFNHVL